MRAFFNLASISLARNFPVPGSFLQVLAKRTRERKKKPRLILLHRLCFAHNFDKPIKIHIRKTIKMNLADFALVSVLLSALHLAPTEAKDYSKVSLLAEVRESTSTPLDEPKPIALKEKVETGSDFIIETSSAKASRGQSKPVTLNDVVGVPKLKGKAALKSPANFRIPTFDTSSQEQCVDLGNNWYDSDGPTYDCEWYGASSSRCATFGNFAENYVRFSFAASRENISKAIEKIDKILK